MVASDSDDDGLDPRAELIRKLQGYEQVKKGADHLRARPELGRDFFRAQIDAPPAPPKVHPDLPLAELLSAMADVMRRASFKNAHQVTAEPLSTRARMSDLLERLSHDAFVALDELLIASESRGGVVVTFLATLELVKEGLVDLIQVETYGPIQLKLRGEASE